MVREHPLVPVAERPILVLHCPLIHSEEEDRDYHFEINGLAVELQVDVNRLVPLKSAGGGFLVARREQLKTQFLYVADQLESLLLLRDDWDKFISMTHRGCGYRHLKIPLSTRHSKDQATQEKSLAEEAIRDMLKKTRQPDLPIGHMYATMPKNMIRFHHI